MSPSITFFLKVFSLVPILQFPRAPRGRFSGVVGDCAGSQDHRAVGGIAVLGGIQDLFSHQEGIGAVLCGC